MKFEVLNRTLVSQIKENDTPSTHGKLAVATDQGYLPINLFGFKGWGNQVNRGGPGVNRTHTVDGKNIPLTGSLSHYLQGFKHIPGGCLGCLNHQQYIHSLAFDMSTLWPDFQIVQT